ncbi:hypothetical protein D3C71_1654550 [compost metagenome]
MEFREFLGTAGGGAILQAADETTRLQMEEREGFRFYRLSIPERQVRLDVERRHDHKLVLRFDPAVLDHTEELLLQIEYTGNVGYAFGDGRLFHDHFHNGALWEIGLSRFRDVIQSGEIVLETTPLRRGSRTLSADAAMAAEMTFTGDAIAVFHGVQAKPVYRIACEHRPD